MLVHAWFYKKVEYREHNINYIMKFKFLGLTLAPASPHLTHYTWAGFPETS